MAQNNKLGNKLGGVDSSAVNKIGPGTVIEGDIISQNDIRIDGTIMGNIQSKRKIMMGEKSDVKGNIQTETMIVMGNFDGEMEISGTLHLHKSAKMNGKIRANKLVVEEGAEFNGECQTGVNLPKSKLKG